LFSADNSSGGKGTLFSHHALQEQGWTMSRLAFHSAGSPARLGILLALVLLEGCQFPAASFQGCAPYGGTENRKRAHKRQQREDTRLEIIHFPARAVETVVCSHTSRLAAAAHGIFGKQIAMRLYGPPPPLENCGGSSKPLLVCPLKPACFHLTVNGEEGLQELLQLIDSAACQIDVLMYTWDDDRVGRCIAAHLAAKASPQVRVRILVDGAANLIFGPPPGIADNAQTPEEADPVLTREDKKDVTPAELNRVVCWLARQPYVEIIRTRNPFGHYDHRKLVLVDGRIGWSGGRNFTLGGFLSRHDITYTVQGPLARELQHMYEAYWREQGGKPGDCPVGPPPPSFNAGAHLVHNSPVEHSLQHAILHAVRNARHSIWVENPYLTDNQFIAQLGAARHRGVDVRVVLTINSDSDAINHASRVTANRLLAAGVRVYLYPTRMHTKAAMVDGCWGYIGTGNFDILSFRRNHELGCVIGEGPFLDELAERLFLADFCPEWELRHFLSVSCMDRIYSIVGGLFM
jgi:cardiolipin synthase